MKKLLSLFLGVALLTPSAGVFAADPDPFAILPTVTEGGIEYLDLKAIDPSVIEENGLCAAEDFVCENIPSTVVELALRSEGVDLSKILSISVEGDNATFKDYDSGNKTVKLRYATHDATALAETANLIATMHNSFVTIDPYEAIDMAYRLETGYYGTGIFTEDYVNEFSDFTDFLAQYDNFKGVTYNSGTMLGWSPYGPGADTPFGLLKNGVLYGIDSAWFEHLTILPVSEEGEETPFEKAEALVNEHFTGRFSVTIEPSQFPSEEGDTYDSGFTNDNVVNNILNVYLGKLSGTYSGVYANLNIDGTQHNVDLAIVEVPAEDLEGPADADVYAEDATTGVVISTNSADVPVDVILEVTDITGNETAKKFEEDYNVKIEASYEIVLKKSTGEPITSVPDGVDVYLPVTGKSVGDRYEIFHINEDGTKGESEIGVVVRIGDKLYIKFTADHFSTYALGEKITPITPTTPTTPENNTENPNTSDALPTYLALAIISLLGLASSTVILRKN